jgi:hypothetical protein
MIYLISPYEIFGKDPCKDKCKPFKPIHPMYGIPL